MRRLPFVVSMIALTTLATLHADPPGEKYAIVVAVRKYKQTELNELKYTESDADELAETLRAVGYKRVVLMTQKAGADDTRYLPVAANIRSELKGLLARKTPNDSVVVAFSGHGVQYKNETESYFCPADAKLKDRNSLVSLGEVYKELEQCKAGVRLLLVDACRNEPQAEHSKDLDRVQLESMTRPQGVKAPGGVAAFFACSAGEKAYESPKLKRGVFFHFVCEGLRGKAADGQGNVTLGDLANYVQKNVDDHVREEFDANVSQWPDYRPGTTTGPIVLAGRAMMSNNSADMTEVKSPRVTKPDLLDCTGANGVTEAEMRKAQKAWAVYLKRPVEETVTVSPGVTMKFALVPPGMFLMGSPENEADRSSDEIQHKVTITIPYDLATTELSQRQYVALGNNNPSKFDNPSNPVEKVSWEESAAYAKKLTEKLNQKYVYRLPTEAEWEYACRGGQPSSRPFGVGDGQSLSTAEANYDGNVPYRGASKGEHRGRTIPVGSLGKPNALGLHDMHGNVWEWCADWYGPNKSVPETDPSGPLTGSLRVVRGGGWSGSGKWCRAAYHRLDAPGLQSNDLGFRLARSVKTSQ